jgi:REP element-mobilizing transposase RayT
MTYNPEIHHRRSIRLKGYDYSQAGLYFITFCVQNRAHLFGKIKNGIMCLNALGSIAYQEWEQSILIRKNISLGAFIVMPNHLHGIIQINYSLLEDKSAIGKFQSPSHNVGAMVRGYKGAATKKIKEYIRENSSSSSSRGELQFAPTAAAAAAAADNNDELIAAESIDLSKSIWQRNYYEHIIRDHRAYDNISNYIDNNPQKWSKDKFY